MCLILQIMVAVGIVVMVLGVYGNLGAAVESKSISIEKMFPPPPPGPHAPLHQEANSKFTPVKSKFAN